MPPLQHSLTRAGRAAPGVRLGVALLAFLAAAPAVALDSNPPDLPKPPKPVAIDRNADDVTRYCANVAPAIAEARIAWQTKRLAELDAQVRQRIVDLEKAEASARDW